MKLDPSEKFTHIGSLPAVEWASRIIRELRNLGEDSPRAAEVRELHLYLNPKSFTFAGYGTL